MARGGQRAGAGRKSSWRSGYGNKDTVSIRVPRCLKTKLLTIAHELDEGKEFVSSRQEKFDLVVQDFGNRLYRIEANQTAIAKALLENGDLKPSTKRDLRSILSSDS